MKVLLEGVQGFGGMLKPKFYVLILRAALRNDGRESVIGNEVEVKIALAGLDRTSLQRLMRINLTLRDLFVVQRLPPAKKQKDK
jgi:hypothetical protein